MPISRVEKFRRDLGQCLADSFGSEFRFYKSRLELRRRRSYGYESVVLSGSSKFSPHVTIAFYFGLNFSSAKKLEKYIYPAIEPSYYHIHQYSLNISKMQKMEYEGKSFWEVDLEKDKPQKLVPEMRNAIENTAFPFFQRFQNMKTARDAIVGKDSWCLSGQEYWRALLSMDAALNELHNFEVWMQNIKIHNVDDAQIALSLAKILLAK